MNHPTFKPLRRRALLSLGLDIFNIKPGAKVQMASTSRGKIVAEVGSFNAGLEQLEALVGHLQLQLFITADPALENLARDIETLDGIAAQATALSTLAKSIKSMQEN
ncbi:hypothetical protein XccvBFoX7_gp94c [Xanthomonas phage FoX7]|uniref:Uncharacterized protein n=2 Tax=Carpasinavirus XcP1 TaxID=2182344 RepID=A0A858NQE8_9CAUD|nr:hypothetical protein XccvBFoX6_gp94c [Xanthomonas phage FoX6]QJB22251.1 hypothetical protein XccvBFoX7_gp94c [Xanthomonas phage FoX7]